MRERNHHFSVLVSDEELEMLHALARESGEPVSVLIRRWARESYRHRFGAAPSTGDRA